MDPNFLKVAKEAALEAGKVISKYFGKNVKRNAKTADESNFVTVADLEAEKVILKILKDNFPTHSFIGEEGGEITNKSEYTWVIDPLDGTVTFAANWPTFAVSIGLLKNDKPIIGVVYQVITTDLYSAEEGKGAYLNGKQIKISKTDNLKDAVIGIDFGHRTTRSRKTETYILPLINKVNYPYSIGSDALILAMVGSGMLDGFANDDNIWDCIAGILIIIEAGGKVTDLKGEKIDWKQKRIAWVASNGLIHEQILEALKDGKI